MNNRRGFLKRALAAGLAVGSGTLRASDQRRIFVAGFSHETNTFHPIRTSSFSFLNAGDRPLEAWKDAELIVVPGIIARPNGGGTIEEKPCRAAMKRILDSLRAALPVEAEVVRLVKGPRMAVIRVGDVEAILAEGPMAFTDPSQFVPCGIDPLSRKIVVVKEGYLYPGLTRIAPRYRVPKREESCLGARHAPDARRRRHAPRAPHLHSSPQAHFPLRAGHHLRPESASRCTLMSFKRNLQPCCGNRLFVPGVSFCTLSATSLLGVYRIPAQRHSVRGPAQPTEPEAAHKESIAVWF